MVKDLGRFTDTVEEISKKTGYNKQYIRVLAKSGKIPCLKRGRRWLFCPSEVEEHFMRETKLAQHGPEGEIL